MMARHELRVRPLGLAGLFLFAAVVISGVIAGVFVAVQIAQVPVQPTLGDRDFVLVKSRFEHVMGGKCRRSSRPH
jgi:hypothetical protein